MILGPLVGLAILQLVRCSVHPSCSRWKLRDTLSSKATDTSKRFIVSKRFIFQNSDFFYFKAYLLRFFHAKFQHFFSTGLASTSFLRVTSFEAFQLYLSDMKGGVSLQTSVTFKRFELECWDWSQIKDFLKEITPDL